MRPISGKLSSYERRQIRLALAQPALKVGAHPGWPAGEDPAEAENRALEARILAGNREWEKVLIDSAMRTARQISGEVVSPGASPQPFRIVEPRRGRAAKATGAA